MKDLSLQEGNANAVNFTIYQDEDGASIGLNNGTLMFCLDLKMISIQILAMRSVREEFHFQCLTFTEMKAKCKCVTSCEW